jgi:hypothetical protein
VLAAAAECIATGHIEQLHPTVWLMVTYQCGFVADQLPPSAGGGIVDVSAADAVLARGDLGMGCLRQHHGCQRRDKRKDLEHGGHPTVRQLHDSESICQSVA